MLIIDDNMFKLAKMQETLLKATTVNRQENLDKYKKIVVEIDLEVYKKLLETLKDIDEHNHSLEEELEFLQSIKESYDQLNELQLSFRKTYETYSSDKLKLSDLSRLNIEYIDNRISTINGYLINLKNIESNKKIIQELNDKLIEEEKKKEILDSRLLELEKMLRYNFIGAEGRFIINGQLQYTSVITEYQKLGFDFEKLMDDSETLEKILIKTESESKEIQENLNAATICYNNYPNSESKQIVDEINKENLRVKYKITMLRIIKLLSTNCNSYDAVKEKREFLLALIKYRLSYIYGLGINVPIDPFSRTKVDEQLNMLLSMTDNSKNITRIRKEIAELTTRVEEMISQNSTYLLTLNDTKELIKSNIGMNDIDISTVVVDREPEQSLEVKTIAENQVQSIKDIPHGFKVGIVSQKTSGVIRRVSQMITSKSNDIAPKVTTITPKLVIVPKVDIAKKEESDTTKMIDDKSLSQDISTIGEPDIFVDMAEAAFEETPPKNSKVEDKIEVFEPVDIFETTVPFPEPQMFNDREEESLVRENVLTKEELDTFGFRKENLELAYTSDEMPELFWNTDEQNEVVQEEGLSFDEQINMLLSTSEEKTQVHKKERKLSA